MTETLSAFRQRFHFLFIRNMSIPPRKTLHRLLRLFVPVAAFLGGGYVAFTQHALWRSWWAYRQQNWHAARMLALDHLSRYPESTRALTLAARASRQLGDWAAAERAYGQLMPAVPMEDLKVLAER